MKATLNRMCINPMQDKVNDIRAAAKEVTEELAVSLAAGVDGKKVFRKFRTELLRVYGLYSALAGKAQNDGEKAMLDAGSPGWEFSLETSCQKVYRTSKLMGEEIVQSLVSDRV